MIKETKYFIYIWKKHNKINGIVSIQGNKEKRHSQFPSRANLIVRRPQLRWFSCYVPIDHTSDLHGTCKRSPSDYLIQTVYHNDLGWNKEWHGVTWVWPLAYKPALMIGGLAWWAELLPGVFAWFPMPEVRGGDVTTWCVSHQCHSLPGSECYIKGNIRQVSLGEKRTYLGYE